MKVVYRTFFGTLRVRFCRSEAELFQSAWVRYRIKFFSDELKLAAHFLVGDHL